MRIFVAGAGLTGAVIARELADAGHKVQVLEATDRIGGNCHDQHHVSGIRYSTFGPHYFRTNNKKLWDYVHRFADWWEYRPKVMTQVGNAYHLWPVSEDDVLAGEWSGDNFEEACLSKFPQHIYDTQIKPYTEKMWGVPAHTLAPDLARRITWRRGMEFSNATYQGIPQQGYTEMIREMLRGIPVALNTPFGIEHTMASFCIYTGPVDALFKYEFGRLRYRSQKRRHVYYPEGDTRLPVVQVNNPGPGSHIRTIEWKHMLPGKFSGTLLTQETPVDAEDHLEYPVPGRNHRIQYAKYKNLCDTINNLVVCGRLGEYRYLDMDQAIARALGIAKTIMS